MTSFLTTGSDEALRMIWDRATGGSGSARRLSEARMWADIAAAASGTTVTPYTHSIADAQALVLAALGGSGNKRTLTRAGLLAAIARAAGLSDTATATGYDRMMGDLADGLSFGPRYGPPILLGVPDGENPPYAFVIASDLTGTVLGGASGDPGTFQPRPCRWDSIGTITILSPGKTGQVRGISRDGSTLVGEAPSGTPVAWIDGVETALPAAFTGPHSADPLASVTSDGSLIAGSATDTDGVFHGHAYTWAPGDADVTLLEDRTDASTLKVNGMSADGSVVVGYSRTSSGDAGTACYWLNGALNLLPKPDGIPQTQATCVSADGSIIGGLYYDGSFNSGAMYWRNGTPVLLPDPFVLRYTQVYGISDDGKILVGTAATAGFNDQFPCFWYNDRATVLDAISATHFGYAGECNGISGDGSVICADGDDSGGYDRPIIYRRL